MMNFINSAKITLLRNSRDKGTLRLMMLLPVVLIFILGTALSSSFTPGALDRTPVGIFVQDTGPVKDAFLKFLETPEIKAILDIKSLATLEDGLAQVKKGEMVGLIVIPADFSEKMTKGEKSALEVYDSGYSIFRKSVIHSVVESFTSGTNTYYAVSKLGSRNFQYNRYEVMKSESVALTGNAPRAIDYYSVTMMIMTIMYGAYYGNFAIRGGKINRTEIRLKASPASSLSILGGVMIGTVLTVFLQSVVLIFFSKYAYQANWGPHLGFILLVCFGVTLLSVSIGVLVGVTFKSTAASASFISVFVMISTFLSGGYVPFKANSPLIDAVMNLFPNYHAQKAIFSAMFTGIDNTAISHLIIIFAAAAVIFLAATIFGRRTAQ